MAWKSWKKLCILLFVQYFVGYARSQLSASDCGIASTCFRKPVGCTSSASCTFLIKYRHNPAAQTVDIDISGRVSGWVAFAFNSIGGSMAGTRGEICLQSSSIMLLEFQNNGYSTPQTRASTLNSGEFVNGALICRYTRPVVPAVDSLSVDLSQPWILYAAYGSNVNGNLPSQHNFGDYQWASSQEIIAVPQPSSSATSSVDPSPTSTAASSSEFSTVFLSSSDNMTTMPSNSIVAMGTMSVQNMSPSQATLNLTETMATVPTQQMSSMPAMISSHNQSVTVTPTSSTSMAMTSSVQPTQPQPNNGLTVSGCGISIGCFRGPSTCTSSSNCDFLVRYVYNQAAGTVDIDISGRNAKWIAFGFNQVEGSMDGTRGEICIESSTVKLLEFQNSGRTPTTRNSPFTIRSAEVVNGALICRYTRPLVPVQGLLSVDLSQTWFFYGAWGTGLSGDTPLRHGRGDYQWTTSKVDATTITSIAANANSRKLLAAHGAVMSIAWVALAAIGFFSARYMKPVFKELFGVKIWFWIHRGCMGLAFLLTIVGVILIFVDVEDWSKTAETHATIGLIVTGLALFQVVFATFRPHPDSPRRWIFNWAHWAEGVIAIILAVVNVFLGLNEIDVSLTPMVVFAAFAGFLIIVLEIHILIASKIRLDAKVEYNRGKGDATVQESAARLGPSRKNIMIRKVVFFGAILVAIGCALACVIIIIDKLIK